MKENLKGKKAETEVRVVQDERSEWGSSGGIGYYDQVRVFYGSQSDMKEWQWRDRYSASNDRHDLRINSIGEVKVSEKDGKIVVKVELVNSKYGNRSTTFIFDKPKTVETVTLSTKQQAKFTAKVDEETERVMSELHYLWKRKPVMVSCLGYYTSYRQPSIKQKEIHPEIGVAAFVTEEQIDHRVDDPQIRYELYVLTAGDKKAKCVAEDYGYKREGGAFLAVLEVNSEQVVINTKNGKSTIRF